MVQPQINQDDIEALIEIEPDLQKESACTEDRALSFKQKLTLLFKNDTALAMNKASSSLDSDSSPTENIQKKRKLNE